MTGAFLSLIDQKLAKLAEIRDGANINRDRSVSAMRDEWENQIKLTFSPTVNPNRQGYPVFLHGDDNVASGPLLEISRRVSPEIHGSLAFRTDDPIATRLSQCFTPLPRASSTLPQNR